MGNCIGCIQATRYLKHFTASTTTVAGGKHNLPYQSHDGGKVESEHLFDIPLDSDDD
jgi:hypothetical protein